MSMFSDFDGLADRQSAGFDTVRTSLQQVFNSHPLEEYSGPESKVSEVKKLCEQDPKAKEFYESRDATAHQNEISNQLDAIAHAIVSYAKIGNFSRAKGLLRATIATLTIEDSPSCIELTKGPHSRISAEKLLIPLGMIDFEILPEAQEKIKSIKTNYSSDGVRQTISFTTGIAIQINADWLEPGKFSVTPVDVHGYENGQLLGYPIAEYTEIEADVDAVIAMYGKLQSMSLDKINALSVASPENRLSLSLDYDESTFCLDNLKGPIDPATLTQITAVLEQDSINGMSEYRDRLRILLKSGLQISLVREDRARGSWELAVIDLNGEMLQGEPSVFRPLSLPEIIKNVAIVAGLTPEQAKQMTDCNS